MKKEPIDLLEITDVRKISAFKRFEHFSDMCMFIDGAGEFDLEKMKSQNPDLYEHFHNSTRLDFSDDIENAEIIQECLRAYLSAMSWEEDLRNIKRGEW